MNLLNPTWAEITNPMKTFDLKEHNFWCKRMRNGKYLVDIEMSKMDYPIHFYNLMVATHVLSTFHLAGKIFFYGCNFVDLNQSGNALMAIDATGRLNISPLNSLISFITNAPVKIFLEREIYVVSLDNLRIGIDRDDWTQSI